MLEETPAWTYTSEQPLTKWFENVRLLPNRVLGYWFCLDRSSGAPLWEHLFGRPREIVGIEEGVIVAQERWTRCGVFGISLETGRLLWTSHASGLWGRILRAFDYVPGDTITLFKNRPAYILDGKCYCRSGRVVDLQTGRLVRRIPKEEIEQHEDERESVARRLLKAKYTYDPVRVSIGAGRWLSHRLKYGSEGMWGEFQLFLTDDEGSVQWEFDLRSTGYHTWGCFNSYRYSAPYVYLVVSRERLTHGNRVVGPNPTDFHLLTLDLSSGCVVQDFQINQQVFRCRIEDMDEKGILVSESERVLRYFEKA